MHASWKTVEREPLPEGIFFKHKFVIGSFLFSVLEKAHCIIYGHYWTIFEFDCLVTFLSAIIFAGD